MHNAAELCKVLAKAFAKDELVTLLVCKSQFSMEVARKAKVDHLPSREDSDAKPDLYFTSKYKKKHKRSPKHKKRRRRRSSEKEQHEKDSKMMSRVGSLFFDKSSPGKQLQPRSKNTKSNVALIAASYFSNEQRHGSTGNGNLIGGSPVLSGKPSLILGLRKKRSTDRTDDRAVLEACKTHIENLRKKYGPGGVSLVVVRRRLVDEFGGLAFDLVSSRVRALVAASASLERLAFSAPSTPSPPSPTSPKRAPMSHGDLDDLGTRVETMGLSDEEQNANASKEDEGEFSSSSYDSSSTDYFFSDTSTDASSSDEEGGRTIRGVDAHDSPNTASTPPSPPLPDSPSSPLLPSSLRSFPPLSHRQGTAVEMPGLKESPSSSLAPTHEADEGNRSSSDDDILGGDDDMLLLSSSSDEEAGG